MATRTYFFGLGAGAFKPLVKGRIVNVIFEENTGTAGIVGFVSLMPVMVTQGSAATGDGPYYQPIAYVNSQGTAGAFKNFPVNVPVSEDTIIYVVGAIPVSIIIES